MHRPAWPLLRALAVIGPLALFLASNTSAIDENLTKGATNNHIFESGVWGENIDLLNGGLNLTIPIGGTYRVAGDVSYQLKLSYSSKIWQIEESSSYAGGNIHYRTRSRLQGRGQAGLGFTLQFGRFMERANSAECESNSWDSESRLTESVFEDSTGATHPEDLGGRGASDGSFMKADSVNVRMPDGTRYVLGPQVPDLIAQTDGRWPRCTSTFPPSGSAPKATFDIQTNDYRGRYVTRIEGKDRVGGIAVNYAEILYETDPNTPPGMKHLMKKITNVRNGVADPNHAITFENTNVDPGFPNDPNKNLEMGYVKSVTVPIFSSNPVAPKTATYVFNYILATIYDPYVTNLNDTNEDYYDAEPATAGMRHRVLLLTGITFPATADGDTPAVSYNMGFEYSYPGSGWGGRNIGFLQARVLPTGARVEYDYDDYAFRPAVCSSGLDTTKCPPTGAYCRSTTSAPTCTSDPAGWTIGIGAKRIFPQGTGGPSYSWTYEREPHAIGRPNPSAVVTTDPFGNDTVTYFHAESQDSYTVSGPSGSPTYNYHKDTWNNGKSYKTEYYRGSYASPGNLVRSEEQVWEDDVRFPNDSITWKHTGEYPRVIESKVTYHDDGAKTARTVNEEWDGFGNFRKVSEYGFGSVPYRVRRADYNCDRRQTNGLCFVAANADTDAIKCSDPQASGYNCPLSEAHWNNWVLGTSTYSQTEDADGNVLQRSEFLYDPPDGIAGNDLGYLKSRKDLLAIPTGVDWVRQVGNPAVASPGDIITEYKYEGDATCPAGAASYPTGNVCYKKVTDPADPNVIFQESYTYQHTAYLATRKVGAFTWKAEDRDIDPGTGLTRVSRDANGIATTFDYDSLGRLVRVTPDVITDPNSSVTELPATLTYPDIWTTRLEQAVSSTNKIFSEFIFDKLGRLIQVDKLQADGTTATQKTQFDIAGRVLWQGEWGSSSIVEGDPSHGTTFDYTDPMSDPANPAVDPFGRVRKTITADGKMTWSDYVGTSSTVTVGGIQTGYGPATFVDATTYYDKDAFGRLTQVLSHRRYPETGPALRAGADALYSYDPLDRLTTVRLESQDPNTLAISSQYRSFTYDKLGRQTSATNPENGTTLNLLYDAAGNLRKRQDAKGNLFTYSYDAASRLLEGWLDKAGADPNTRILANTYDQTETVFGYGLGKLTTSISYDDAGVELLLEETRFKGQNGRVSGKSWRVGKWNSTITTIASQPELVASYAYNALGLLKSTTYPDIPGSGRTVAKPEMTYTNGYLTSMSDPARGALVEAIQYNPAGGVYKIRTRGAVETTVTPDVRNRPATLAIGKLSAPTETLLASQGYSYDGAGNITAIGDDKFAYDALSRLVQATVNDTASAKIEVLLWNYDPLGNMTSQMRTTTSGSVSTSAQSWFSLDDPNSPIAPNNKNQIRNYGVDRSGALPDDASFAMQYDGNGNLMGDRVYDFIFDARNRLVEVHKKADGSLVSKYTYDAGGYRLSKYDAATGMTTYFFRDAGGQTVSEFRRPNRPSVQPSWLKDYLYAVGRHVAMIENEAPATPSGISVTVSTAGQAPFVSLTWAANQEPDLFGYWVDRYCVGSPCPSLLEDRIAEFDVSTPELYDTSVVQGSNYNYKIAAYDTAIGFSEYTDTYRVKPGDNVAPSPPTAGAAVAGDGQVTLGWTASTSSDLLGYRVYRKLSSAGTWAVVGGLVNKSQTSFTDLDPNNGTQYDNQVKAVDTTGLSSSGVPVPVWQVTPIDTTPPEVPQGLYGVATATKVDLYWKPSTASDFKTFRIYRSTSPMNPAAPPGSLADSTVAHLEDPNGVTANTRYYYRVRAMDDPNNLSALSEEFVIDTKDSALAAPSLTAWQWGYCNENLLGFGACYLPQNLPAGSVYTHENYRQMAMNWTQGDPNATLTGFRVYSRQRSDEPYVLSRVLPIAGNSSPTDCMGYPLLSQCRSTSTAPHNYLDFAFNPDDACQPVYSRVSAVGTIGGASRESVLTSSDITMPSTLRVPENLLVAAEPISSAACNTASPPECPQREDPAYYGLTLNWTATASNCAGQVAGYHVYRTRHVGGAMPPIRLTWQPLMSPTFRVEYLPLVGRKADLDHGALQKIFAGPMGTDADAYAQNPSAYDTVPKSYAVTTVDIDGNQSGFSQGVMAHTNAPAITNASSNAWNAPEPPLNTEDAFLVADFTIPPISQVAVPAAPTGLSFTWRYGKDTASDVGPTAGNWVVAKWTLPATGKPNEFALMQHKSSDPDPSHYVEVPLDFIPGDDSGIRQFIWAMPLELACEDANYAMKTWDIYGRSSGLSNITATIPRMRLVPENVTATAAGGQVSISWGALPQCWYSATSHALVRYVVERSDSVGTSCGTDPNSFPNTLTLTPGPTATGTGAFTPQVGGSTAYWYRVRAVWGNPADPNAAIPSDPAPAVCISANGTQHSQLVPAFVPPGAGDPEESWRLAESSGSFSPITSGDHTAGFAVEPEPSPHRIIGQSGGVNPAVKLSFYHLDHLGTPRVITDVDGNVVSRHKYLPFGEELSAPPSTNTHEFTGHERDAETGLDYALARYYGSASTLRFLSVDPTPSSVDVANPQSWNRYSYVQNNPIRFNDPLGLNTQETTTKTTTYRVTFKDKKTGETVYQTEVTVTEKTTTETDDQGKVLSTNSEISATAKNTGSGASNFSESQLGVIGDTVSKIYSNTPSGKNGDLGVAVGAKESQLGAYGGASLGPQSPSANPLQLSTTSGFKPTADKNQNISTALNEILFPNVDRYGLREGLERYNGTPTKAQYATDVLNYYSEIKDTQRTRVDTTKTKTP